MFSNVKVKNIRIDFYSNRIKGQILKEFSILPYPGNPSIIYKNLIQPVSHENLIIGFEKYKNRKLLEIHFQNISFSYVRRYLEEIFAFKDDVINDMSQARIDIGVSQVLEKNVNIMKMTKIII